MKLADTALVGKKKESEERIDEDTIEKQIDDERDTLPPNTLVQKEILPKVVMKQARIKFPTVKSEEFQKH